MGSRRRSRETRGTPESPKTEKTRVVFFDVLRILCVAAVVYIHQVFYLVPWFNTTFFSSGTLFNIYPANLGGLAVYGLIFVSGAVLELNYRKISTYSEHLKFLLRRCIRLYPAFWMSLVAGACLFPVLLTYTTVFSVLVECTGFYVILGKGPGLLNPMGWFIAAIVSLYFFYPWLSRIIRKAPLLSMVAFLVISYLSRFLLISYTVPPLDMVYRWLPLCNFFEFCLGIAIVQNSLYPKNAKEHPVIRLVSDLSYYVFLFNVILIAAYLFYTESNMEYARFLVQGPGLNNQVLAEIWYYGIEMGLILAVSGAAMAIDRTIQRIIADNERIKKFFAS
jgi:hypothetical protein